MFQASLGILAHLRSSFRSVFIVAATAALASTCAMQAQAAKSAAIVVDANTGKTLYSSSADARRYPASLTKMMTLYMVFEAMETGRIGKSTRVPFSAHASSRPPTKLGVRPGGSVTVETAILALVTKSANDAAAALGELLGGTESDFARMMTAKARKLGMSSTTFRNASGLPDSRQVTSARDMATLGIALREHFPRYYSYFSTRSMTFGKTRMGNHNKLLGRVKGVDGIKTGYTRASGFNLVSSVRIGDRKMVAVVMGGASGRSRDARMAELIRAYSSKLSSRSSGPLLAARGRGGDVQVAAFVPQKPKIANVVVPLERPERETQEADVAASAEGVVVAPKERPSVAVAAVEPPEAAEGEGSAVDPVKTASVKSGWVIQVGSVGSKREALSLLDKTASKAPTLLASLEPFTEVFEKSGTVYHRARFAGFGSQKAATRACAALKKKSVACYATMQ